MNNLFGRSFWIGTAAERVAFAPDKVATRYYSTDTAKLALWTGSGWLEIGPGAAGAVAWGSITGTLSTQTDLQGALDAKAPTSHTHTESQITNLVTDLAGKEPANSNIQTHVTSAHAPANAQKNSDITKAEIEAKLTGEISTHTHAGGGGGLTHGQVMQRVFLGV